MAEKQIYVVGNPDFALGFRLAGIKNVIEIESFEPKEYERALENIVKKGDAGLLIVDASDFNSLSERKRTEFESLKLPVILALSADIVASENLRRKVVQAIGVDLLKS